MTETPEQRIRIYKKDPDGNLHDAGEVFCVSDFCGVVPRVGDFIVSRWLRDSSEEGRVWSNRPSTSSMLCITVLTSELQTRTIRGSCSSYMTDR